MTEVEKLAKTLNDHGVTHFSAFVGRSLVEPMSDEQTAKEINEMIDRSKSGKTINGIDVDWC